MKLVSINLFRGFAFILMFIFHIFVIKNILTPNYTNLNTPNLKLIGEIARYIFIILVGTSLYLSYKNTKNIKEYKKKQLYRSINILLGSFFITLFTFLFFPDYYIVFGVLHFISIAIFILHNYVNNLNILIIILIICFYLSNFRFYNYNLNKSYISFISSMFGFSIYKNTIDSFPLINWIPVVIYGIFLGYIIDYNKVNIKKYDKQFNNICKNNIIFKILEYIGKNTLTLYLIHFIIIYIVIILFVY